MLASMSLRTPSLMLLASLVTGCAGLLGLDELSFEEEPSCSADECDNATDRATDAAADAAATMQCTSHRECTPHGWDEPRVCSKGTCVDLKNDSGCELVLGEENLQRDTPPFVVGLLSGLPFDQSLDSLSYALALREFSRTGLEVGGHSVLPVGVVCDIFDRAARKALARSIDRAPYLALVHRAEDYLQRQREAEPPRPLKLALVESNTPGDAELGAHLDRNLMLNGIAARDNGDDAYLRLRIESRQINEFTTRTAEVEQLLAFEPDLIVAATEGDFLGAILVPLEVNRSEDVQGPFYVLPPITLNAVDSDTLAALLPAYADRVVGVGVASAQDNTLMRDFSSNLESEFPGIDGRSAGNFYDAGYFGLYVAAAASGTPTLSGRCIGQRVRRAAPGCQRGHARRRVSLHRWLLRGLPCSSVARSDAETSHLGRIVRAWQHPEQRG